MQICVSLHYFNLIIDINVLKLTIEQSIILPIVYMPLVTRDGSVGPVSQYQEQFTEIL